MKVLYLDCGMGAAGDMLSAALLELLPEKEAFIDKLNGLQIPGVRFEALQEVKAGITGTRMKVSVNGVEEGVHEHSHTHDHEHSHETEHTHDHEHSHETGHEHEHTHEHEHHHQHHHHSLHDIEHLVGHLAIPEAVKKDILGVYALIAEAESRVHGMPVSDIHFHEVGTMDAVADVTAVCLLLAELAPDQILASPVCVGSGTVQCAHGILPVPAPATAHILQGIPIYSGPIKSELCTPTGAALLKHFVSAFCQMPVLVPEKIGYGMGQKEFAAANCVRAIFGTCSESAGLAPKGGMTDEIIELSCNVDDMTAEELAFASDRLLAAGAKDVYTIPIGMKKSRPGTLLCVLCKEADRQTICALLFRHTTTIGIRESVYQRYILDRKEEVEDTPYGPIRKKISEGYGVKKVKYEYDDLADIAAQTGRSLAEIKQDLEKR